MEAAAQNLERQKKFVLNLIYNKMQSCSTEEQQQTKELLDKMLAEDEKSKVSFQIDS